jgi:hypothetical protein
MKTKRADLNLMGMVDRFMDHTREEDPTLARSLASLDTEGRRNLGGILGRFNHSRTGSLDSRERLLARRVLGRLRKPTTGQLTTVNKILDYLDLNSSALLEPDEIELCIKILEKFSKVESQNDSLSDSELKMLYAVLRYLDKNNNHVLDADERLRLNKALDNLSAFMKMQRIENPYLQEVLAQDNRAI